MGDSNKGSIEYNISEIGMALAHYINNVDSVSCRIGEYKEAGGRNGEMYQITGYQLEEYGAPIDILSTLDTDIEITEKFSRYDGKSALGILNDFLTKSDIKNKAHIVEKFKGMASNKVLLVPFKVGSECTYIHSQKAKEEATKISAILWTKDKEDGKFKSSLLIKTLTSLGSNTTNRVYVSEYNKQFKVTAVDRSLKSGNINRDIINMDRFGMIHPIEVYDRNIGVALDCLNLYLIVEGKVSIIGRFGADGELHECELAKSVSKHKSYKYLRDNLDYISKHLRFIAPYNLVESTKIDL